jgi:predicted porin
MKKTLIALAAIAAVGSASAQFVVGGKLDVGYSKAGSADGSVKSGVWETSRLVVKGDTDLGSGLKGSAYLEGGLGADLSTATFSGFGRQAFVSVAGSFGKIDAGSMWSPIDTAVYYADAMEYNGFTPMNNGFWNADTGNNGQANASGSIQYTTPDMGGVVVQLMAAPGGGDAKHTNYMSGGVNYAAGPLLINAAMQTFKTEKSATSTSTVAAVQYNVGVATIIGGYASDDTGTVKGSGFNIGVKVPMGADYIAAAYSSYDAGAGAGAKTGFGVNYIKAMGKTTIGYLGYKSVDSVNTTGAGLRYNF